MPSTLRLATRGSPLAVAQANRVAAMLTSHTLDLNVEIVVVETTGDRRTDVPLHEIGGQGVFVAEVQRAVLDGRADAAVHSAKDLPSTPPPGLLLAAVPERVDPADVLVGRSLAGLGPGALVATGSPRRRQLLAELRPDLAFTELRGNMATRLAAPGTRGIDAVVAASAALLRLGLVDQVAERLDPEVVTPQVGQGAIAIEAAPDCSSLEWFFDIDDAVAHRCVDAERAFLATLGAGCTAPVGAWCTEEAGRLTLRGMLYNEDAGEVVRYTMDGASPEPLGVAVATWLLDETGGCA
jgi:hydroxymethylbilane synthase